MNENRSTHLANNIKYTVNIYSFWLSLGLVAHKKEYRSEQTQFKTTTLDNLIEFN